MAIDFPSSPAIGQQHPFTPVPGQPVYIWDGEKWIPAPVTGAVRYDAAQSLTAAQQLQARQNIYAAPFDALAYNGMQINGGMEVSQENGSTGLTAASGYPADMFSYFNASGGAAVTFAQVADAPLGFNNSIKATVTTGRATLSAADEIGISHAIEGYRVSKLAWGTANAQSLTLSFWCKTHRTGMYSGAVGNPAYNRTYAFTWTQSTADVWEYKTVTIPGDTTGVWPKNNGAGLAFQFLIAGGTGVVTTANIWTADGKDGATGTTNGVAAATDIYQITGVTVIPGTQAPTAAQSPFIMRPYDQELVTCQRYFEWCPFSLTFYSAAVNAPFEAPIRFAADKRVVPTLSATVADPGYGTGVFGNITGASIAQRSTHTGCTIAITSSAAAVTSYVIGFRFSADARL